MNEVVFYPRTGGFAAAQKAERQLKAQGYATCLIGHPDYTTQIVRYWRAA